MDALLNVPVSYNSSFFFRQEKKKKEKVNVPTPRLLLAATRNMYFLPGIKPSIHASESEPLICTGSVHPLSVSNCFFSSSSFDTRRLSTTYSSIGSPPLRWSGTCSHLRCTALGSTSIDIGAPMGGREGCDASVENETASMGSSRVLTTSSLLSSSSSTWCLSELSLSLSL